MTMTRQGLIHVLQALQHADDMIYHDIHEHGDGLYSEDDHQLAAAIDVGIAKAAKMLDALYPEPSDVQEIDDALMERYQCLAKFHQGQPFYSGPHLPHDFTYGDTGQYTGHCGGRE